MNDLKEAIVDHLKMVGRDLQNPDAPEISSALQRKGLSFSHAEFMAALSELESEGRIGVVARPRFFATYS